MRDTSNRAINLIINNLKGIFFRDDDFEHMAFRVVAKWSGYMQLMEAAYPEFVDALRNKERIMILNINLSEKGKPPL